MWQLLVRRSPNKLCDSIQSTVGRSSYRIQRADRSGDDLHGSAGGRGCRMEFVEKILVGEGSNTDDYEIALRSQNCGTVGFERRVPATSAMTSGRKSRRSFSEWTIGTS